MKKPKHPYVTMKLHDGDSVWVRAKILGLSEPGTLGYAHGFVSVSLQTTNGLAGGGMGTVTVQDIKKERK